MNARHKTALATATLLALLGAGSVMFGPKRVAVVEPLRLAVPVAGVKVAQLVDSWGAPRSEGRRHQGVDIMAAAGTPVTAVASGKVLKLVHGKRGGTTVYQSDDSGAFIFYYAHLSSYAGDLKEGMPIRRGQLVGYVGQTGNAKQPHLHFEVLRASVRGDWRHGRAMNPYLALKAGQVDVAQAAVAR